MTARDDMQAAFGALDALRERLALVLERLDAAQLDVSRLSAVDAFEDLRMWQADFEGVIGHGMTYEEWRSWLDDDGESAEDGAQFDALDEPQTPPATVVKFEPKPAPAPNPNSRELPAPSAELNFEQREALDLVVAASRNPNEYKLVILTGFAGTGKTFALREIVRVLGQTVLLAPTGKAALRIRESTDMEAKTVHSWLYAPKENVDTGETYFARKDIVDSSASRVVIVDEASMLTRELFTDLRLTCAQLRYALVLVGDPFQLPPVQDRNAAPFSALDLQTNHRVLLTKILRQAEGNPIIGASMRIREGRPFDGLKLLYRFQPGQVPEAAFNAGRNGGITIVHRNATRAKLNYEMRRRLGYLDPSLIAQPDEPLMVTRNNAALSLVNGEVVKFIKWLQPPAVVREVRDRYRDTVENLNFGLAEIEGGRQVVLCHQDMMAATQMKPGLMAKAIASEWGRPVEVWDELGKREEVVPVPFLSANYGYIFTCHKAQGSQWPTVLVVLEGSVRLKDEDGLRWAYTAVTRATHNCAYMMGNI